MTLDWVDFIAGWCSGAAAVIAVQPVDTVLTRIQAQRAVTVTVASGSSTAPLGSVATQLQGLVTKAGLTALWRGSSPMISAVPCQNALLMGGYGAGKRWSEKYSPENAPFGVFVGGCTGGVVQSFLMSPVELIKVKQQVAGQSAVSATSAVAKGLLSREIGWRGLNATLLRDGIPHGVWFLSYEVAKQHLESRFSEEGEEGINFAIPLVSGAFAAAVAWGVGYPFDLIKTRIQANADERGVWHTGKELVREADGRFFAGLYRGFGLKLLRAVPASAIGFVVYEGVKDKIS